jgi:uncharacterized protein
MTAQEERCARTLTWRRHIAKTGALVAGFRYHCTLQSCMREIVVSLMWYAIYALDHADSLERRKAARPAHLERLNQLRDAGRMLLAGPFPAIDAEDPGPAGFSGSLIVAEFADLAAAQAWADADPYLAAGVYRELSVRPFRKVLP